VALLFTNAGSERVDVGSAASLDDILTGTILAWIYPTVLDTGGGRVYQKSYLGADGSYWVLAVNDGAMGRLHMGYSRPTGDLNIAADVVTTNAWQFVGAVFNGSGVDADQKMYRGTLAIRVAEVGAYFVKSTGSGTHPTDAGSTGLIGNRGNFNVGFPGRIAWLGLWNRQLSVSEIETQQFRPRVTSGCVGFWDLHGTGTQYDQSGNGNHGTVTGATAADHVPLSGWRRSRNGLLVPYVVGGTSPTFHPAWARRQSRVIGAGVI
jgi:hypothetical protein